MSVNRTLTQIQTSVGTLFIKTLPDLVRGIRNHKDDESKFIGTCVAEIKEELISPDKDIKVQAIEKLSYLQMLGYPMDWASFRVIECIAHEKWTHKRIGYLAANVSFSDTTEVIMLVTNLLRKDCLSPNVYEAGLALNCLSNICTTDLARDLVPDIVSMLGSSRPYIRKKAVLVMYKIFLRFPDALRPSFPRLKDRLDDPDPSVVSSAVNVICELARKNARNYLVLAPVLYKLLTKTANNWMLIKIVKLFSVLIPLEERLGKKLVEPLTSIINETNAMSLLYECIQTCVIGLSAHKVVMRLCVTKLRMFIEHPDQNLKYLGLVALSNIMKVFPRGIVEHRDLILNCLEDEDETIRRRAIELIAGMVDSKNLSFIVDKLKGHLEEAEGVFKDELLEKIIEICSQEKYKFITDFEWYLGILLDLTAVKGIKNGGILRDQIMDVCVRVKVVREGAIAMLVELFEDTALVTESPEVGGPCEALFSAAWIVGEYSEHCAEPIRVITALLSSDSHGLPSHVQAAYLQCVLKLLVSIGLSEEETAEEDLTSTLELIAENLPVFMESLHIEAQERACSLDQIIKILQDPEVNTKEVLTELQGIQTEALNPVSKEAPSRVKVPEGLDLEAWINEPMPEDEPDEPPLSRWEEEAARYKVGESYGGDRGHAGREQYEHPDTTNSDRPQWKLDEEAIRRGKLASNVKNAGNMRYLPDSGPGEEEPDLGPVRQLPENVLINERLTFNNKPPPRGRGRGRAPRMQRPAQAVVIADDENPEGWVEEAQPKKKDDKPKDALSMVILDASAENEVLPERRHHEVAKPPTPQKVLVQQPPPVVQQPRPSPANVPRGGAASPAVRGGRGAARGGAGGQERGRGRGAARGAARGTGTGTGRGRGGPAKAAIPPTPPPTPVTPPTPTPSTPPTEPAEELHESVESPPESTPVESNPESDN